MVGLLLILCLLQGNSDLPKNLSYHEFWMLAKEGKIANVMMTENADWRVILSDGTAAHTPNPRAQDSKERLLALGVTVTEQGQTMISNILMGVLAITVLLILMHGRGKGAMGLQKYAAVQADENIPQITFDDVAVAAETLQSMRDLVSFLREPECFARYGARVPKGVMLYGPPGTGKTLLAKALAGEAKAPFFAMSGADFVQVYVGVGASRVRELFKKARKAGGGVIFIDEIDAIGKKRDNGNDEREQTLNALLTEMSGFSNSDGIIVLAATNRIDTLDAALLREGRFDRRIEVNLPDADERLRILQVHARSKPLSADISLESLAKQTTMFSGAQLETLLNEAAIRAARRKAAEIELQDLEKAYLSVTIGDDRPQHISEMEKRITAYHEAGHALITHQMIPEARITRITIIPSSRGAAGYSMSIQPDKLLHTRRDLMAMICAALGGRAAEELIFGAEMITTGASGDLKKVREIARGMADEWGMGETGNIEEDIRSIERQAMKDAQNCLKAHQDTLHLLAKRLIEQETLNEAEILALMG